MQATASGPDSGDRSGICISSFEDPLIRPYSPSQTYLSTTRTCCAEQTYKHKRTSIHVADGTMGMPSEVRLESIGAIHLRGDRQCRVSSRLRAAIDAHAHRAWTVVLLSSRGRTYEEIFVHGVLNEPAQHHLTWSATSNRETDGCCAEEVPVSSPGSYFVKWEEQ